MTWLGFFNIFFFQWFFIRLAKVFEDTPPGVPEVFIKWTIIWGVIPTTGWKSDFKYLPGFKK